MNRSISCVQDLEAVKEKRDRERREKERLELEKQQRLDKLRSQVNKLDNGY